jgi:hypothetical protein
MKKNLLIVFLRFCSFLCLRTRKAWEALSAEFPIQQELGLRVRGS